MKTLLLVSFLAAGSFAQASIQTHLSGSSGKATIVLNVADARLKTALRDALLQSAEFTAVDNMYVEKNIEFTAAGIHIYSKDATELSIHLEETPVAVDFSASGSFISFSTESGIAKTLYTALLKSRSSHVQRDGEKLVVMATPGNYINPNFSCTINAQYRYACELHD